MEAAVTVSAPREDHLSHPLVSAPVSPHLSAARLGVRAQVVVVEEERVAEAAAVVEEPANWREPVL